MVIYRTKEKHKPHFALRKQAFSSPANNGKVKAGIHKAERVSAVNHLQVAPMTQFTCCQY